LTLKLTKDVGLKGVKFTLRDVLSRIHWQFGPDGLLSPPAGSYKDNYDDEYTFSEGQKIRKIEFGITKSGS
jgi:hypothetical protein